MRALYDYDVLSNLTKIALNKVGGGAQQKRELDYDGRGTLVNEINPELHAPQGQVKVRYTADSRGHILSRKYAWEGGTPSPDLSLSAFDLLFSYDRAERSSSVLRARDGNDPERLPLKIYQYYGAAAADGQRNQLQSVERYNYFNDPNATNGVASYKVLTTYSYCAEQGPCKGMLASIATNVYGVTPSGQQTPVFGGATSYVHDARGNLSQIRYPVLFDAPLRWINYEYTADMLTSVKDGASPRAVIGYDTTGLVTSVQYAAPGVSDQIASDANGLTRPKNFLWNWTGGSASSGDYVYDGAGNISRIGGDTYGYDAALRLIQTRMGGTTETIYGYDEFGNMTRMGNRTYTVDSATNHVTSVKVGSGTAQPVVYGDHRGNITQMPDGRDLQPPQPNASMTQLYDPFNNLIYMAGAAGSGIGRVFVYDRNDERIGVINFMEPGGRRELWSLRDAGNRVLRDFERTFNPSTGQPFLEWKKDYIYRGTVLSNTVGKNANGVTELHDVHVDHLGSLRYVTGPNGQLLNASSSGAKYMPFGTLAIDQNLPERLAFTGHERDDDGTSQGAADLDYMHARYYVPALGRFLSVDPGRDWDANDPQRWNLYTYVRNNPVRYNDPTGKELPFSTGMYRHNPKDIMSTERYGDEVALLSLVPVAAAVAPEVILLNSLLGIGVVVADDVKSGKSMSDEASSEEQLDGVFGMFAGFAGGVLSGPFSGMTNPNAASATQTGVGWFGYNFVKDAMWSVFWQVDADFDLHTREYWKEIDAKRAQNLEEAKKNSQP